MGDTAPGETIDINDETLHGNIVVSIRCRETTHGRARNNSGAMCSYKLQRVQLRTEYAV